MLDDDVLLIRKILSGDDTAFSTLVQKYRKGVHAFAWRKIGDFHFAEEITQDTFIQVYQNLSTLRNPNQFAGWLYVIANRLCLKWQQKRKIATQSLEGTSMSEINASSYNKYASEQREAEATERRLEIVNKLLKKLPESERTVITLYYLGEMTAKDIGKFLGVSINTIKSRLHRARERLKEEESMIRENLSSVQFPTQTTENIMKEISQLKPTAPSGSKPLVPIGISTASAMILLLLMGVGMQYLFRFQKPYSLESTSETTIEIVEAQLMLDSPAKTAARNQVARSDVIGGNNGTGQQPDTQLFAAAQTDDAVISNSKSEWVQTKGPEGGAISTLFTTTRGDVHAGTQNGLYRLTDDGTTWKLINTIKGPSPPFHDNVWWWPVAERQGTLYLATDTEILESTDRGETWETLCEGIKGYEGHLVGIVLTAGVRGADTDMTIYLVYRNGVFRTEDVGKTWTPLHKGLIDTKIRSIAAIQDTVFAGTHNGLYRLNGNVWEQVSIDKENMQGKTLDISALTVSENHLYVAAQKVEEFHVEEFHSSGKGQDLILNDVKIQQFLWFLYHSNDRGDSWNIITPKLDTTDTATNLTNLIREMSTSLNKTVIRKNPFIRVAASGEKVLVVSNKNHFYSINVGQTWTHLDSIGDINNVSGTVLLNDNTVYRSGLSGIHRTTKGDASWHKFNAGIVSTFIHQLININNTFYANIGELMVVRSTDSGESWIPVTGDADEYSRILEFDGNLYAMNETDSSLRLFRFSHEANRLTEIPDVPVIEKVKTPKPNTIVVETYKFDGKGKLNTDTPLDPESFVDINTLNENLTLASHDIDTVLFMVSPFGSFAVSRTAYYVEYKQRLFRWKPGTTKWYDTGLIDKGKRANFENSDDFVNTFDFGFKLAVAKNTVYVGTRDKRLMQSFDEGDTWNDVTADLPFPVDYFKEIVFEGQTVYVATDKGVVRSINGIDWQVLTDAEGKQLVVERFAVDKSMVYGLSGQKVYQLTENSGTWKQVAPEITHSVSTFEADGNTVYIGTQGQGVFRFTLDDSER